MRIAYLIFVGYAVAGFLYLPGLESAVALIFIALSCSPLLLAYDQRTPPVVPSPPGRITYWAIVVLGFVNIWIIARNLDRGFSDVFSFAGLVALAASSTGERYGEGAASGNPVLLALSLWLIFRVGAATNRMPKILQLVPVVPVLLYTLATTEKWPSFLVLVFFFAGLLSSLPRRDALRVGLKYLSVVVPVMLVVFTAAVLFRNLRADLSFVGGSLFHYVLAPYPAFGAWLMQEALSSCCTLGRWTFVGPLDAMGAVVRQPGVWQSVESIRGRETNIYTSFRYLIEDFSILGPFVLSGLLTLAHVALRQLASPTLAHQVASFTLFCALMSLSVTPFVHNSVVLAMMLSLVSVYGVSVRLPTFNPPSVEARRAAAHID